MPLRLLEKLAWVFIVLFFTMNLASGEWVFVAAIGGSLAAICFAMLDLRIIAILWFAGSPTIFVFANNILDALPFLTVERALFFGLCGLMVITAALRRREKVNMDMVEKLVFVYLGIVLAALLRNFMLFEGEPTYKEDIAFYLQGYVLAWMSYWLMRRMQWTEKWVMRYLWAIALASVIIGFQGVGQNFLGIRWFNPTWIEVINEGRATGVFSNATEYGLAALVSLLFCMLLQGQSRDPMRWIFLFILLICAALGLALCKTRAPWLAALISFAILFRHDKTTRPLLATGAIIGGIAGMIALPFVIDSDLFQRRILDLHPIYARIALFGSGFSMLLDNPILGIGFGKNTFETEKVKYLVSVFGVSYDEGSRTGPPHNEWLGIMAMTGVFGFVTYIWLHVEIFRKLKRMREDPTISEFQRRFSVYALCLMVSQVAISFFIDIGYLIYSSSATLGAVGIACATWKPDVVPTTGYPPKSETKPT
ncbi:O-antigen ligase family protein [Litoreibacter janthinus]|nr:O-antigen ligase family protein [Litoreibacter janthinus]